LTRFLVWGISEPERWRARAAECEYHAKGLARIQGISLRQLERDFRHFFDMSPQRWLDLERLKVAKQLLASGHAVKVVAVDLGYRHASHFCRHFKMLTGDTPVQFAVSAQCGSVAKG
jgi:transcriptional regulator GlxA family with amidase domain